MSDKPRVEVIEDDDEVGPDFSEPVYDSTDPVQVRNRQRRAGRLNKEKKDFILRVLEDKAGRAWMWELLTFCGTMRTSVVDGGDPYKTYFNEGQRNVGLKIVGDITNASPDLYVQMVVEAGT